MEQLVNKNNTYDNNVQNDEYYFSNIIKSRGISSNDCWRDAHKDNLLDSHSKQYRVNNNQKSGVRFNKYTASSETVANFFKYLNVKFNINNEKHHPHEYLAMARQILEAKVIKRYSNLKCYDIGSGRRYLDDNNVWKNTPNTCAMDQLRHMDILNYKKVNEQYQGCECFFQDCQHYKQCDYLLSVDSSYYDGVFEKICNVVSTENMNAFLILNVFNDKLDKSQIIVNDTLQGCYEIKDNIVYMQVIGNSQVYNHRLSPINALYYTDSIAMNNCAFYVTERVKYSNVHYICVFVGKLIGNELVKCLSIPSCENDNLVKSQQVVQPIKPLTVKQMEVKHEATLTIEKSAKAWMERIKQDAIIPDEMNPTHVEVENYQIINKDQFVNIDPSQHIYHIKTTNLDDYVISFETNAVYGGKAGSKLKVIMFSSQLSSIRTKILLKRRINKQQTIAEQYAELTGMIKDTIISVCAGRKELYQPDLILFFTCYFLAEVKALEAASQSIAHMSEKGMSNEVLDQTQFYINKCRNSIRSQNLIKTDPGKGIYLLPASCLTKNTSDKTLIPLRLHDPITVEVPKITYNPITVIDHYLAKYVNWTTKNYYIYICRFIPLFVLALAILGFSGLFDISEFNTVTTGLVMLALTGIAVFIAYMSAPVNYAHPQFVDVILGNDAYENTVKRVGQSRFSTQEKDINREVVDLDEKTSNCVKDRNRNVNPLDTSTHLVNKTINEILPGRYTVNDLINKFAFDSCSDTDSDM